MANTRQSKKNRDEVQRMFGALGDVRGDIVDAGYNFGFFLINKKEHHMEICMAAETDKALIGIAGMLDGLIRNNELDKEFVSGAIKHMLDMEGGMYDEG